MKVLLIHADHTLRVTEVERPELGPYDAECRMLYGTICAGKDTHVIDGHFGELVSFPSVIGHESIVRSSGSDRKVRHLQIGDQVARVGALPPPDRSYTLSWGGMCERGVARDHRAMKEDGEPESAYSAFRVQAVIPRGLLAHIYELMFITWRETLSYCKRIGITEGALVRISGSGANGLSLAAMARTLGARVALMGSESRVTEGLRAGAYRYVSYRDTDAVARLVSDVRGEVNVLIDATGRSGSVDRLLPALKNGGVLGVYGKDDLHDYKIRPLLAGSFRIYNLGYDEAETQADVIRLIRAGALDPSIWIRRESAFDWANVLAAFEAARSKTQIKPVVALQKPGIRL